MERTGSFSNVWQWKLLLVIGVAAALCVLVEHNWSALNGPWYWKWIWRRLDPVRVVGWFLIPSALFFTAQWVFIRWRKPAVAIAILMLAFLGFELAAAGVQRFPFHLKQIAAVIENKYSTSFYTDAMIFAQSDQPLDEWLAHFHDNLKDFHVHSMSRGPGAILYHWSFIKLFGTENHRAAMLAGLAIGVLATWSIPATYWISRCFWHDSQAAFASASCLALCPGMVWFFPIFDPIYVAMGLLMIALWARALDRDSLLASAAFGAWLAAVLFLVYNLLVLGFFLLGYTILFIAEHRRWAVAVKHAVVAIGIVVLLYSALWLATGYRPFATFFSAVANQTTLETLYHPPRPLYHAIPLDLIDFLLGLGWIAILPASYFFMGDFRSSRWTRRQKWLLVSGLLQIGIVACVNLISHETARVWMFMAPFLLFPVGLELSAWPHRARMLVYIAWLGLMMSIGGNMWFQTG